MEAGDRDGGSLCSGTCSVGSPSTASGRIAGKEPLPRHKGGAGTRGTVSRLQERGSGLQYQTSRDLLQRNGETCTALGYRIQTMSADLTMNLTSTESFDFPARVSMLCVMVSCYAA